ncbi:MAG TPA: VTT domain-containing protein [Bacteroidales bacterium]|jgi:membrane protein YqaA with SNARE-associated domain|nr:VTT domain-containing protein [Bacteroidales bacterium]
MEQQSKSSFFLQNLIKGMIWLGVIVALFVFTKHYVDKQLMLRFEPLFSHTILILSIFTASELIIGIIPPELFLIWSLRSGELNTYILYVLLLSVISYLAGLAAYLFGRYLHNTKLYQYLRHKYLLKSEIFLQEYGLYLILVAALTPVPFSGSAMLVGSVHYPVKNYIYWSLSRFIKFALTAWIIWEANML